MAAQFSLNPDRDGVVTDLGSGARTVRNFEAAAAALDAAVAAWAGIDPEQVTGQKRVEFLVAQGGTWPA